MPRPMRRGATSCYRTKFARWRIVGNKDGRVPTSDHFAVMAAFGTHGNDAELSNRELIAKFREFEKENPFALRACKSSR